ncbi:hypothetical protein F444_01335 [Phytophthora nicotianae P1976]|uniref:Uncharacterized protein n=1 Tax=Phytophthora nicotianae P1976 TaxID=1317066 RepID=A0A081B110_PHYNI|nr:hypothetical protein F444_01335 [Phytophthora nicotianae P1976]
MEVAFRAGVRDVGLFSVPVVPQAPVQEVTPSLMRSRDRTKKKEADRKRTWGTPLRGGELRERREQDRHQHAAHRTELPEQQRQHERELNRQQHACGDQRYRKKTGKLNVSRIVSNMRFEERSYRNKNWKNMEMNSRDCEQDANVPVTATPLFPMKTLMRR